MKIYIHLGISLYDSRYGKNKGFSYYTGSKQKMQCDIQNDLVFKFQEIILNAENDDNLRSSKVLRLVLEARLQIWRGNCQDESTTFVSWRWLSAQPLLCNKTGILNWENKLHTWRKFREVSRFCTTSETVRAFSHVICSQSKLCKVWNANLSLRSNFSKPAQNQPHQVKLEYLL